MLTQQKNAIKGFTLIELCVSLGVVIILGMIAYPFYKDYQRRMYFAEIVQIADQYRGAVESCLQNVKKTDLCNTGMNHIPKAITVPRAPIYSLTVIHGVITVIPVIKDGVNITDTYILTPTIQANGTIRWLPSGGSVEHGYVKQ